jgi:AcrR family transcriptional regulator
MTVPVTGHSDKDAERAARDRILDATDRLLIRYGYRKMTVEDIAVEAGIGKGTVYLSFPSKEEIALSCIDRMVDGLLKRLHDIANEPRGLDERLLAMLRLRVLWRFDYASSHSASLDALLAAVRPSFLVRRAEHFRSEVEIFTKLLEAEARHAGFRVTDPMTTATALIDGSNALLPFSLSTQELGRRAEVALRVDNVAALLISGLRTTAGPPRHVIASTPVPTRGVRPQPGSRAKRQR